MSDLEEARISALGLHKAGQLVQAEVGYRRVLAEDPSDGEAWHLLAVLKGQNGQHGEAASCCRRALEAGFSSASLYFNLARALAFGDEPSTAVDAAERGLAICTDDATLGLDLASIMLQSGRPRRGLVGLRLMQQRFPGNDQLIEAIADTAIQLSLPEEARSALNELISLNPSSHVPHLNLANLYFMQGMTVEAEHAIEAVWQRAPDFPPAYLLLSHLRTISLAESRGRRLVSLADTERGRDSAELQFAAGRVFEGAGRLDRAFEFYHRGNSLIRRGFRYDEAAELGRISHLCRLVSGATWASSARGERPSTSHVEPLFIMGMPRSGSTLMEVALSRHPEVASAGESVWLQRLIRAAIQRSGHVFPDGMWHLDEVAIERIRREYLASLSEYAGPEGVHRFCIDKLPANILYVPLIARLFPGAPIILMQRDGLANCVSCFRHLFSSPQLFAYDMAETARYWSAMRSLAATYGRSGADRLYQAHYEALVRDPRKEIGRILAYCGLSTVSDCFVPSAPGAIVRTASAVQVRSPFVERSVEDVHRYRPYAGPILEIVESVRNDSPP